MGVDIYVPAILRSRTSWQIKAIYAWHEFLRMSFDVSSPMNLIVMTVLHVNSIPCYGP